MQIPDFTLKRVTSTKYGTFGVLIHWEEQFALTAEPPWKDNRTYVSCIPAGKYICKLTDSPKFGRTYLLQDVPDRSHILFHKGNFGANVVDNQRSSTKGCILIGEEFGRLDGEPALLSSARGFTEFLQRTSTLSQFIIRIQNCF